MPAHAADEALLLDVVVNAYPLGKIGEFVRRDGKLLARAAELRELGIRVPASVPSGDGTLVPLASLPGVAVRLDQAAQRLFVTAANDRLLPELVQAGAGETAASLYKVESGTGATLDYDLTGTSSGGQNGASGLFDLRAFSPWGVASTGVLAVAGFGSAGGAGGGRGAYSAVRLNSTYVFSDPDRQRRYRLGDLISGGLDWTRPLRLGGIQINSDFSLRPDLVTFPLPAVGGSVAVPSTLDVLVNGTRLLSRQVRPGPFQVPQLPVVSGAGSVELTVTDPLGRQVTTTLPFYASASLLAPGLQTYSVEVGAVRRNYGVYSVDYGGIAGAATYRRGIASFLTVETHAEGAAGVAMGGAGVLLNVFDYAIANFSASTSHAAGRGLGAQFSAGVQRQGRVLSLGASATIAGRGFRDVAAANGDPVPRRRISANAGLALGRYGSLGVAYSGLDRDTAPAPVRFLAPVGSVFSDGALGSGGFISSSGGIVSFTPAQKSHIVSASYTTRLGRFSFYATGYRDMVRQGGSGALFGVTLPLGGRSSAGLSAGSGSSGNSVQVQAAQSVTAIDEWGYQINADRSATTTHGFAELDYKSPWAQLSAGVDRSGRQTTYRGGARGALSFVDRGLFASNTIDDSFAIVDTGVPGIRVLDENRVIGRTNRSGRLLLPDLRSFELNHIAIDPLDVPTDASVPTTTRDVRPQDRSGVVVRFPVTKSRGALLRLVDAAGVAVPVGSAATLEATGAVVPVGFDGEAFAEGLVARQNRLLVVRPDGKRCVAVFDYTAIPGDIPVIGPLQCKDRPR